MLLLLFNEPILSQLLFHIPFGRVKEPGHCLRVYPQDSFSDNKNLEGVRKDPSLELKVGAALVSV